MVPVSGFGVTYDHSVPIFLNEDDSDEGIRPLCDACDDIKTPRDLAQIAKTKRQAKMATKKPKGTIRSRGFQKGPSRWGNKKPPQPKPKR